MKMTKKRSSSFLWLTCTAAAIYGCILLCGLQFGHPQESNAAARKLREFQNEVKTSARRPAIPLQSSKKSAVKGQPQRPNKVTSAPQGSNARQDGSLSNRVKTNSTIPPTPKCAHDAPPLNFTLDDIDYSRTPTCGNNKCFFRSRYAPQQLGYLIADGPLFKRLRRSWEIACSLGQYGNHKHIYTETPPTKIPVSNNSQFLEQLRTTGMKEAHVDKYRDRETVAVLQVKAMPPGFSEVGCQLQRQVRFITNLYSLLGSDPIVTKQYVEEVDKVVDLLRHEPRLAHDFQIMVESDGSVTHFDLDRWESKEMPTEALETCICNLKKEALLLNEHNGFVKKIVHSRRFMKLYTEHPEFFAGISECNNATYKNKPWE